MECSYLVSPTVYFSDIMEGMRFCSRPQYLFYDETPWANVKCIFRMSNLIFDIKGVLTNSLFPAEEACYIVILEIFLVFIAIIVLTISVIILVITVNWKKLYKGDLVTPWKREFGKTYKEDVEYVVGFVPISVPFVKKCINSCGKQTMREDGECIHCYEYREFYKKEPPIKTRIQKMILMMNKRQDNEFGKLPKHLVVYFIKNYL
jgi:hypothetical protein